MRVAVAGAGIAGLTAAIALARRGIAVEVFERTSKLEEVGAGIQLSPNAVAVLERLDVLGGIRERLTEPSAIEIRDAPSGRRLTSIPLGDVARRRYGLPYYVGHRADLQTGLLGAARRAGVDVHLGAEVTDPSDTGNSITFGAGGTPRQADVLLVADGVHSTLRKRIFGYPDARLLAHVAWRAMIPVDKAPTSIDPRTTGLWLGPGAHLVQYAVSGGQDLNLVVIAIGDSKASAPPSRGFGEKAQQLLDTAGSWSAHPLFAVDPGRPYARGRFALMGDAAHAMPPSAAQGGAQAIEDGWTVAAALAASGDDTAAALRTYDHVRRPRAERVARNSFRNLGFYEMRRPAADARNLLLRILPATFLLSRLDWLFRWKPPANNP